MPTDASLSLSLSIAQNRWVPSKLDHFEILFFLWTLLLLAIFGQWQHYCLMCYNCECFNWCKCKCACRCSPRPTPQGRSMIVPSLDKGGHKIMVLADGCIAKDKNWLKPPEHLETTGGKPVLMDDAKELEIIAYLTGKPGKANKGKGGKKKAGGITHM